MAKQTGAPLQIVATIRQALVVVVGHWVTQARRIRPQPGFGDWIMIIADGGIRFDEIRRSGIELNRLLVLADQMQIANGAVGQAHGFINTALQQLTLIHLIDLLAHLEQRLKS